MTRRSLIRSTLAASAAATASAQSPGPVHRVISSGNGLECCKKAREMIASGDDTLDAVIAGVNIVELDPDDTSVGYGGLPNEEGVVELDSCVMHGPTRRAGSVASLRGVKTAVQDRSARDGAHRPRDDGVRRRTAIRRGARLSRRGSVDRPRAPSLATLEGVPGRRLGPGPRCAGRGAPRRPSSGCRAGGEGRVAGMGRRGGAESSHRHHQLPRPQQGRGDVRPAPRPAGWLGRSPAASAIRPS